jgi:hypothetical protein
MTTETYTSDRVATGTDGQRETAALPVPVGPVSEEVTRQQLRELRAEVWLPVLLIPFVIIALGTGHTPATGLLGAAGLAGAALAQYRWRHPAHYISFYTDPIARAVVQEDGLVPRPEEERLELRVRIVDTLDSLEPRPLWLRQIGRDVVRSLAFCAAVVGVGFMAPLDPTSMLVSCVSGSLAGVLSIEWPRSRRSSRAKSILEAQLRDLDAHLGRPGAEPSGHPDE